MMAITTNNSTNVKPVRWLFLEDMVFPIKMID